MVIEEAMMPKIGSKEYGYNKAGMAAYRRDLRKKKAGSKTKNGTANRRKVAR